MNKKYSSRFSLVELLVVIAIIAILCALVLPTVQAAVIGSPSTSLATNIVANAPSTNTPATNTPPVVVVSSNAVPTTAAAAPAAAAPLTTSTNPLVVVAQEAAAWISTPDTNNNTLTTAKIRVETGPVLQSGLTVADEVFLQYNAALSNRLAVVASVENASIAGTIAGVAGGVGYNLYQKYDTEVTVYALAGWRANPGQFTGGLGAKVRHMLNSALYVAPGVEIDFGHNTAPKVTAEAGVAF